MDDGHLIKRLEDINQSLESLGYPPIAIHDDLSLSTQQALDTLEQLTTVVRDKRRSANIALPRLSADLANREIQFAALDKDEKASLEEARYFETLKLEKEKEHSNYMQQSRIEIEMGMKQLQELIQKETYQKSMIKQFQEDAQKIRQLAQEAKNSRAKPSITMNGFLAPSEMQMKKVKVEVEGAGNTDASLLYSITRSITDTIAHLEEENRILSLMSEAASAACEAELRNVGLLGGEMVKTIKAFEDEDKQMAEKERKMMELERSQRVDIKAERIKANQKKKEESKKLQRDEMWQSFIKEKQQKAKELLNDDQQKDQSVVRQDLLDTCDAITAEVTSVMAKVEEAEKDEDRILQKISEQQFAKIKQYNEISVESSKMIDDNKFIEDEMEDTDNEEAENEKHQKLMEQLQNVLFDQQLLLQRSIQFKQKSQEDKTPSLSPSVIALKEEIMEEALENSIAEMQKMVSSEMQQFMDQLQQFHETKILFQEQREFEKEQREAEFIENSDKLRNEVGDVS
ncbi:uncharacterized protein MONOS_234 [Monocercomonoides exilis]|uniref:uncharacterized protein n=1 Tax=Monocercomonoides exilis TaxID=2049356 RepID=UPI00355A0F0B|nr:hypothetical protein MONOS_234 [Monocercomonoides exilis]|eukprot:MONOS_234.1-p1 / transcript=MONOS_234.1 / gene=MONOS_234 / organism=Monocercomonoides_exilis_PA203 / gene_product=unspecified product / transcript_product=unspecified product / location=Mono_scaffold00004:52582-54466(-) / protein_length=515 / sequence_SO=supercontig / SO=protein_coding / is_pseudo=false